MAVRSKVPVTGTLGPLYLIKENLLSDLDVFCRPISVPQERRTASNGPFGASGTQTADDDDGRDEQDQKDAHSQNSDHNHLQVDLTVLSSEPAVAQANIFIGGCVQHTPAVLVAFLAVERLGCHVTTKEDKSVSRIFTESK
jgi:hypothetical protein